MVLVAAACRPDHRSNVLLISIDTLRNDHCSVSGYARPTTPRMEALARQGVRLALAYAPSATTGPTHASIFTSRYPITHGVLKNGMKLGAEFDTLAETLRRQGYATTAIVSSFVLNARFGLDRGFDTYDDDFAAADATIHQAVFEGAKVDGGFDQRGDVTTRKARAALRALARGRQPFFLFVHYFDPHNPYDPPARWAALMPGADGPEDDLEAIIARYDGEIAFVDDEIGRLLDEVRELGLESDTVVVLVADHGEGLMQHGHMEHGAQIYEEAVRVPLVYRLPGRLAAGKVLNEPVELLDVFPTILSLTGTDARTTLDGRSIAAALEGREALDPRRPVYLYRRHYLPGWDGKTRVAGDKVGIRLGTWKYIEGAEEGTKELFDLATDPGETVNLHDSSPGQAGELAGSLARWRATFGRSVRVEAPSPEDRERLRALGYVE